jgi:type VI protein secretion system component VasK
VHREQDPRFRAFFDPMKAEQLAEIMEKSWETSEGHNRSLEEETRGRYALLQLQFARDVLTLAELPERPTFRAYE